MVDIPTDPDGKPVVPSALTGKAVTQFKPGNKEAALGGFARDRNRPWKEALEFVRNQSILTEGRDPLIRMARSCFKSAIKGNPDARKEIGDRLDGKPIQQIETTQVPYREVTDEQLDEHIRALAAEVGIEVGVPGKETPTRH